ncbi:hypothetical protein OFO01_07240 [Campylobacter sp. JMF_01 NE2]|uniref:hypothetical protein n=1 Tax=unclassified Campylobacter TaxID=2593542 RepID=UPI0022E9A87D|nr:MULTISPECIES: hypothetical protein [unclassified Campylobacter]MDA3053242.1 hypothetical protein [Campylobacter sp. JMF_03 NE3]MDA3067575.1 hypothetical protein [Campylobacter sp. JMF_01 NE2]
MEIKVNGVDIETTEITGVSVNVSGTCFIVSITATNKIIQSVIEAKELDISEGTEFGEFCKVFQPRLFADINELLFSSDPFLNCNEFTIKERANFICERTEIFLDSEVA